MENCADAVCIIYKSEKMYIDYIVLNSMECRTHQKRIEIVNSYYVTPIEHNIIVNGGFVQGDAGKDLKNEYYKFIIKNKNELNVKDIIICGGFVAHDFAELLNVKLPSIFDIFISNNNDDGNNDNNERKVNNYKIIWDNTNKQLYNAIRIIMLKYNIKPFSPLYNIYIDVINNKSIVKFNNIKGCNTILFNINKSDPKTLTNILSEFSEKNPEKQIKQFDFSKLTNCLLNNNIEYDNIYLK